MRTQDPDLDENDNTITIAGDTPDMIFNASTANARNLDVIQKHDTNGPSNSGLINGSDGDRINLWVDVFLT